MSIRVMAKVWDIPLPPTVKLVALALADHCHDDGSEARPSRTRIATKCGISTRQVVRILRDLEARGIIEVERPSTANRPTVYRFTTGDVGVTPATKRGDIGAGRGDVSDTPRGDVGVTLTINNHHLEPRPRMSDEVREMLAAIRERR